MTSTAPSVQVEFVERAAQLDEELWRACFPEPWEGLFWYRALEESGLEDQFRFAYALIRQAGTPVGIAPCFVHDVPINLVAPPAVAFVLEQIARIFPRIGYQRTLFIGSPCSEGGRIGLVPGVSLAGLIPALRAAVCQRAEELGAPMIVFKDFAETDQAALGALAGFCPTVSYPGSVVVLSAPGKDAYLVRLSHNQRHNLRKKLRRSAELLPLTTTVVSHPSDHELREILGLFQQTYERGRTKFERLGLRFFECIRGQPPARFILQRDAANGELVTFMLVFHLGGRVVNKFIGLDYRRGEKVFLYFRLFDAALDWAYAAGATELHSGQTGYRAKLDLGHRLVPLWNFFRHRNPLVHALFGAIGRRITWRSLDPDLAAHLAAHPDSH